MECAARTAADKKGGHLALKGEQMLLREAAQCPDEDEAEFQNTDKVWCALANIAHDRMLAMWLVLATRCMATRWPCMLFGLCQPFLAGLLDLSLSWLCHSHVLPGWPLRDTPSQ